MSLLVKKITGSLLSFMLFLFISTSLAEEKPYLYEPKIVSYKDIQLLGNALSILQFVSTDNKDSKRFVYSALESMAEALDRYSFFVPPELVDIFVEGVKDKYVGIGINVAKTEGNNIEILSVEPEGPAFRAGIKPKDIIISIDKKPVNKMPLTAAMKLIRNPSFSAGSRITLMILRNNEDPKEYVLTREIIKQQTIEAKILSKGYVYIRVKRFNKSTAQDFKKIIQDIEIQNGALEGLIIDLRNNPGGDIQSSIDLARVFINSGIVATLDSYLPESKVTFKAEGEQVYKWPVVIIVNEGSASASELFSGSMQFHKRGIIVGKKTFGKGTFQSFVPLSDDMGLYITLGKYYLPDGSSVENSGLTPDIIIDRDAEEETIINTALKAMR